MSEFKKILSLKISEYESLFDKSKPDFIDNCKFINGIVNKMLKDNIHHEEILGTIDNIIKSYKDGSYLSALPLEEKLKLLISKYKSLFTTNNEFYGKDFESNCKFIEGSVKRILKSKETEEYILSFLNDCIKYHKNTYYLMSLPQDKYFEAIIKSKTP